MYLFTSKNSSFDELVEKATSESLPMTSENLAMYFEICDLIRGKSVPAKDAMRSLKKRIIYKAPNVQYLALKLTDACVKNGGHHFLVEIASCEFMDTLVSQLRIQTLSQPVRVLILQFIQSWALAFQGKPDLEYTNSIYSSLKEEGCWNFPSPPVEDKLGGKAIMIDTVTIPDWSDSSDCERCRALFTFINRKHHCRACGRTVCQDCSSKSIPLPHFGIKDDVRVCDGCFATKGKPSKQLTGPLHIMTPSLPDLESKEQEEIDMAIALSLADKQAVSSQVPPSPLKQHSVSTPTSADDPDLVRAIAASLADMKAKSVSNQSQLPSTVSAHSISSTSTIVSTQPVQTSVSLNQLSNLEINNIQLFSQMIRKIEAQGQANAILQTREIASFNQSMTALQPKLSTWLHETLATHHALSEMSMRLSEAVHLYESMLQQRIMHPSYYVGGNRQEPLPYSPSTTPMVYSDENGSVLQSGIPLSSQYPLVPPNSNAYSSNTIGTTSHHTNTPPYFGQQSKYPSSLPMSSSMPHTSLYAPTPPNNSTYNPTLHANVSAPPFDPTGLNHLPPVPVPALSHTFSAPNYPPEQPYFNSQYGIQQPPPHLLYNDTTASSSVTLPSNTHSFSSHNFSAPHEISPQSNVPPPSHISPSNFLTQPQLPTTGPREQPLHQSDAPVSEPPPLIRF